MTKLRKFDLERVLGEVRWAAEAGAVSLGLADANFGIFPRDVEIAEEVASETGHPCKCCWTADVGGLEPEESPNDADSGAEQRPTAANDGDREGSLSVQKRRSGKAKDDVPAAEEAEDGQTVGCC